MFHRTTPDTRSLLGSLAKPYTIFLFSLGRGYPLTRYDFCTPRNFFLLGATRDRTREGQGKRHHSKPMRRFPQLRHQGGAVIAIIVAICLSVGCSYGKQFHLLYT